MFNVDFYVFLVEDVWLRAGSEYPWLNISRLPVYLCPNRTNEREPGRVDQIRGYIQKVHSDSEVKLYFLCKLFVVTPPGDLPSGRWWWRLVQLMFFIFSFLKSRVKQKDLVAVNIFV